MSSSDEKLTTKELEVLAKPFLRKLDDLLEEFRNEIYSRGMTDAEVYYVLGQYLGCATGALGAVQLQHEAADDKLTYLTGPEVLDALEETVNRASRSTKEGFLNLLVNKYGLDMEALQDAAKERVKQRALAPQIKATPAVDPKDFN